ncbi:MAG TPA: hypothetical protein VHT50_01530 [Mycobacterium sp.]|jgi:ABC-type sugar transport system substrate-binding protein|nr:hypothetical protein [Mycobacterium sp.]
MTRLPMIGAIAAGILIGVLPPAIAAAAPASNADPAASTAAESPTNSNGPFFVSMMRSMSHEAQATETIDEQR